MEQKLVAIADRMALIPEYYSVSSGVEGSLIGFPGFVTSLNDEKTVPHMNMGGLLNLAPDDTEEGGGDNSKDSWEYTVGSIRRASSPILGLICSENTDR